MSRALVIGYGSIGRRHVRLLAELGCDVAVVSRRPQTEVSRFADLDEAIAAHAPDYVVVANETSRHLDTVEALAGHGFTGRVLIEKPLFSYPAPLSDLPFARAAVAYNLRFHAGLVRMRELLADEEAVSVQVYCGQDLRGWRPGTDYRAAYSAKSDAGGGVLRDLSHELDYLLWMFGPWRSVAALGGRLSALEIDSDDCWGTLMSLERCPVATLQVNYIDRPGRRAIVANTRRHTFVLDFGRGILEKDGEAETFQLDSDQMYRAQHEAMLGRGAEERLCSLAEGAEVMDLIAAIERAAKDRQWVNA